MKTHAKVSKKISQFPKNAQLHGHGEFAVLEIVYFIQHLHIAVVPNRGKHSVQVGKKLVRKSRVRRKFHGRVSTAKRSRKWWGSRGFW